MKKMCTYELTWKLQDAMTRLEKEFEAINDKYVNKSINGRPLLEKEDIEIYDRLLKDVLPVLKLIKNNYGFASRMLTNYRYFSLAKHVWCKKKLKG